MRKCVIVRFVCLLVAWVLLFCVAPVLIVVGDAERSDWELGDYMDEMDGALKALRRVDMSERERAHKLIDEALVAAKKTLEFTPSMIEEMPDGPGKSAAKAEYEKMMKEVIKVIGKYKEVYALEDEEAFIEAFEKVRDELRELKNVGHEAFHEEA